MEIPTSRQSLRRGLISAFVCFHVAALLWWNLGVIEYSPKPRPDDAWRKIRGAMAAVDPSGVVREVLRQYVRGSALWQLWIMFPYGPRQTSMLEIRGVLRYEAGGKPVYDPVPIRSVDDVGVIEYSQRIGLSPCAWRLDDDPTWVKLRSAYAHYRAQEAERIRGTKYAGIEFVCHVRALPAPGDDGPEAEWQHMLIWSGPFDRNWDKP